jgi:perosamine synthetase
MLGAESFQVKVPRGTYFLKNRDFVRYCLKSLPFGRRSQRSKASLRQFFADYYQRPHVMTCSSCRMALHFVLKALRLETGHEVLMTPITIPDIVNVVLLQGLVPRFVDLDPQTHGVDFEDLQKSVSGKTRILLVTHLSGVVQDMEKIREFCVQNGLVLIEDVSQSHGASHGGRKLGSFGEVAIASMTIGKSISTFMGGVIMTGNSALAGEIESRLRSEILSGPPLRPLWARIFENFKVNCLTHPWVFSFLTYPLLRLLDRTGVVDVESLHKPRNSLRKAKKDLFYHDQAIRRRELPEALYFDINEWQAGLALAMTSRLDRDLTMRNERVSAFLGRIVPEVRKYVSMPEGREFSHNHYHVPLCVPDRDLMRQIRTELFTSGIDVGGYSLELCSRSRAFSEFRQKKPGAELLYDQTIFLPIDECTPDVVLERMAKVLNGCLESQRGQKRMQA